MKLSKLIFLIHPFTYAELHHRESNHPDREKHRPFLERESRCAEQWRERIRSLASVHGLCIMTGQPGAGGPLADYITFARSLLGDRCFVLDAPYPTEPSFWKEPYRPDNAGLIAEIEGAFTQQASRWNKEELTGALLSLACCRQLRLLLGQRMMELDAALAAESWGESFEGCALKFSLCFRRLLGIRLPIPVVADLTVPDFARLVDARCVETITRDDGLRCFLFEAGAQLVALFTTTSGSLADPPHAVKLRVAPGAVTVLSKQGIRLWPEPEPYHLPQAPLGYAEPVQQVVRADGDALIVPVTSGYVWRLAKAPAYVVAATGTSTDQLLRAIRNCELVG